MKHRDVPYRDRRDAGRLLAAHLEGYASDEEVLVLALPRGGVPVGFEVARALHAPLDVFVVRKLGFPGHEEYAMGAIASGGVRVLNEEAGPVSAGELEAVTAREQAELLRREHLYRGMRLPETVRGRIVIVVDDGLATGSTMRAAIAALRLQSPARLVVASPVGAAATRDMLRGVADEVVCPSTPEPFRAVGLWYRDFPQTGDDEVSRLLDEAARQYDALPH